MKIRHVMSKFHGTRSATHKGMTNTNTNTILLLLLGLVLAGCATTSGLRPASDCPQMRGWVSWDRGERQSFTYEGLLCSTGPFRGAYEDAGRLEVYASDLSVVFPDLAETPAAVPFAPRDPRVTITAYNADRQLCVQGDPQRMPGLDAARLNYADGRGRLELSVPLWCADHWSRLDAIIEFAAQAPLVPAPVATVEVR